MKALLEYIGGSVGALEVDGAVPEIRLPKCYNCVFGPCGPWRLDSVSIFSPISVSQRRFVKVPGRAGILLYQEVTEFS